jgi:three-Cys-motif partner protein
LPYNLNAALSDHEFGGVSTDLKLSMVEGYLSAFTTALRGKFAELWYIDAFAGTGERTTRHAASEGDLLLPRSEERIERQRGSARIAIDVVPHFDRLVFIDKNPRHCDALRSLSRLHPDRKIEVLEGDANQTLRVCLGTSELMTERACG